MKNQYITYFHITQSRTKVLEGGKILAIADNIVTYDDGYRHIGTSKINIASHNIFNVAIGTFSEVWKNRER